MSHDSSIILFCPSLHLKHLHRLELLATGKKRTRAHAHTCNIDMSFSLLISCQPLCHAGLTSLKSLIKADNGASSPWCIISTRKIALPPRQKHTHTHTHSVHRLHLYVYKYMYMYIFIPVIACAYTNTHEYICLSGCGPPPSSLLAPRSHARARPAVLVLRLYVFWWYESWPHLHANRKFQINGLHRVGNTPPWLLNTFTDVVTRN